MLTMRAEVGRMNFSLIIILLMFFFSFILIFYSVATKFLRPKAVMEEQFSFYLKAWSDFYGRTLERRKLDLGSRLTGRLLQLTADISKKTGIFEALQLKLVSAGASINVTQFILYHLIALIVIGAAGDIVFGIWGSLFSVLLTAIVPILFLDYQAGKRQTLLGEQLPELLTGVAGLLKVGHGFYQAIDATTQEMNPPISLEFKKVLTEARLGISFEQALDGMAKRVQNQDFNWLVIAVKIQRETGGNLSEILDLLATAIRDREQLKRQIKTLTAEGRLSAYILIGLPFFITLILFIINPGYIGLLFTTSPGLIMLALAAILMTAGIFWLRNIIKIEV